ncbi:MAG: ribonuclease degrades of hybrids (modular protein) [Nitrospira sp.]|jgi:iron complex transport system ATP-binding protein|nr:ribonuclease degrades of hybrids (modular protein) [Nitrospira sp.]
MTIIEIQQAMVYRGGRQVFSDLSLRLERAVHCVILGPNGAGKSTLLKLFSMEIHPVSQDHTRVRLFGEERWNVWDLRRRLGVVSHDLHRHYLDDVQGVNVILSGYYASVDTYEHQAFDDGQRMRAAKIMEELGVGHLQDRRFGDLSTGEQRRFLLGRALVHDPEVLVFDEPTSGLDPQACFHYLALLRSLMAQGKTIILVTHHVHEIPPEISRVVLLKQRRIVGDGSKEQLLTSASLTALFDIPLQAVQADGWYQILPDR